MAEAQLTDLPIDKAARYRIVRAEIAAVIAPKLMGGLPARTPLGELGFEHMDQVPGWQSLAPVCLGADLLWRLEQP